MGLKKQIKRALPTKAVSAYRSMRYRLALRKEFRADRIRYYRHCSPGETYRAAVGPKNLEAQLTKDYHRIEKGLALPEPKRPFGAAVEDRITGNIAVGRDAGTDEFVLMLAASAKEALQRWNQDGVITDEIAPIADGGGRDLGDVDSFFRSRHSVRDFDTTDVPELLLTEAVSLALQSPSVCNRQAWSIRFFRGDEVPRVLTFQNGNKGFTHVVPVVGLVTVDVRLFAAPGERNQAWIEGGIFAMSLVWALHALGLDSCMLNMSVGNDRASALRKAVGIADNELIIMMIAVGYARKGHRVARSPRRGVQEVIVEPANPVNALRSSTES